MVSDVETLNNHKAQKGGQWGRLIPREVNPVSLPNFCSQA